MLLLDGDTYSTAEQELIRSYSAATLDTKRPDTEPFSSLPTNYDNNACHVGTRSLQQTKPSSSSQSVDPQHSKNISNDSIDFSLSPENMSSFSVGSGVGYIHNPLSHDKSHLNTSQLMELASQIQILEFDYPWYLREPHYDILLMYTKDDEILARAFRYVVESCIILQVRI